MNGPTIGAEAPRCTVVVTVDADPDVLDEMEVHARRGLAEFAEFAGFIAGALHRSTDRGRLIQYLQWRSEAAYRACIDHPRWDELPSTAPFLRRVESGAARLDVRIYDIIATS